MKKIISALIVFFYSCCNAYAFSELYYLKNVNTSQIAPIIKNAYSAKNFSLYKENPYYGINNRYTEEYATVILQQSGNNMFYYYNSNDNKTLNRYIIRQFKSADIVYEQSENTHLIGIYDNLASQVINPSTKPVYNFEDNVQTTPKTATATRKSDSLRGYVAQIEKGTKFGVYLQNPINTSTAQVGDEVIGILSDNWTYNGYTIAPQGSVLYGSLTLAHAAQYASRNGRVVINFDRLVTPDGKTYNISTEKIDFTVENDGKVVSTVKDVATGAIVGALGGLLIGALAGGDHIGRAVAIGTGIGAGGSLITSTAQKGVDAEIPSYTELEVELSKSFRVTLSE